MYYNKFTKRNYEFTKGGTSMAQQKPGVMLYFEMRNVFEELSNEKRGILVSAILDYSEHGIQPDFRGSLRIAWASIRHKLDRDDDNYARKSQVRRYAVYIRESKKDGVLPLPYEQWLASLPETSQPETSNDTNRYPTTTTTATATATSTTTATSTDCCYMPAAGKPPRQPQRLIPPTVEEVRAYAAQRGDLLDPEAFMDYYTANGWKVGRNPMKDWKAAVRTWARKEQAHGAGIRNTDPAAATDAAAERYGVHL